MAGTLGTPILTPMDRAGGDGGAGVAGGIAHDTAGPPENANGGSLPVSFI